MPPRYAYWTIIAGGLPTAFRAADRDELMPTFQRIREKHPDAQMKWFARGKLWESPEVARAAQNRGFRDRPREGERTRSDRRGGPSGPPAEKRGRDWRPGGEHRDPRQKFVDVKKQRNAALRKERWERKSAPDEPTVPPPGPAEQGRKSPSRPFQRRGGFPKGPRQ